MGTLFNDKTAQLPIQVVMLKVSEVKVRLKRNSWGPPL